MLGHQWIHWHTELPHTQPINNVIKVIWKIIKRVFNMNWDEFIERYLIYHEEFEFKCKNYIINLQYSRDGSKYVYYICEYVENESLFMRIKNRNKYLQFKEFESPQELLKRFSIENKSIKEIWNEIEW